MRPWLVVVTLVACTSAPRLRTIEVASPRLLPDHAPEVTLDEARAILPDAPDTCGNVECLLETTYAKDARAKALALAMYRETGSVAGVGPEELMDGGYRGKIQLVPQLPVAGYRQHLTWVLEASRSIDQFFTKLYDQQPRPAYRWRALQLRFVRSVKKRTPSAYAIGWLVEYNVEGSLLTTANGVRETLFHELFHSNDGAHADWSAKTLQHDYDAIVAKCGGAKPNTKCLAPYAPNDTMVRGGTYYAFQPNNGNAVHEYAAELAVRYWEDHMQILATGKLARKPFKCGPPENARAWKALVDEFFAGRDLTPAC
jgi:predicted SnoaL-like aldol condensation-catalyzing enzyme